MIEVGDVVSHIDFIDEYENNLYWVISDNACDEMSVEEYDTLRVVAISEAWDMTVITSIFRGNDIL